MALIIRVWPWTNPFKKILGQEFVYAHVRANVEQYHNKQRHSKPRSLPSIGQFLLWRDYYVWWYNENDHIFGTHTSTNGICESDLDTTTCTNIMCESTNSGALHVNLSQIHKKRSQTKRSKLVLRRRIPRAVSTCAHMATRVFACMIAQTFARGAALRKYNG